MKHVPWVRCRRDGLVFGVAGGATRSCAGAAVRGLATQASCMGRAGLGHCRQAVLVLGQRGARALSADDGRADGCGSLRRSTPSHVLGLPPEVTTGLRISTQISGGVEDRGDRPFGASPPRERWGPASCVPHHRPARRPGGRVGAPLVAVGKVSHERAGAVHVGHRRRPGAASVPCWAWWGRCRASGLARRAQKLWLAPFTSGIGTSTTFERSITGDCSGVSSKTPRALPATTKMPIVSPVAG